MVVVLKEFFVRRSLFLKVMLHISLFALVLLSSSRVFASADHHHLPIGIVANFELQKSTLTIDDEVLVTVTYTNISKADVRLLKRDTVLGGGMTEDLFSVKFQDQELAYSGAHVKRLAPIASDYVTLKPGESVSQQIDLLRSYRIDYKGDYKISLREESSNSLLGAKSLQEKTISLNEDRPVQFLKRPPRFENCSASQQSIIDSALTSAERIANESSRALRDAPVALRPSSERYVEWFGAFSSARYAQVESGMARIASATSNQTIGFDCDCTNQPGVNPANTFAFVFTNDAFNMTLCDVFFRVPREGTDSQSGTIVHEISHFNVVASTDDFSSALDQRGSRNLARSSPANAIRNANAFEYFAENTPFLSIAVPTTPADLTLVNLSFNQLPLRSSSTAVLSGQVQNVGGSESIATTLSLVLAGAGVQTFLGQVAIPSIAAESSRSFSIEFDVAQASGLFSFEACLAEDDDNSINNCLSLVDIEVVGNQVIIAPILPLLLDD